MRGVSSFAAGESGWFAIDRANVLWHGVRDYAAPQRVAEHVIAACVGDGTDYHITRDGTLWQWDAGRARLCQESFALSLAVA
jgi:hypothetical protein